jgi:hypothetical protein
VIADWVIAGDWWLRLIWRWVDLGIGLILRLVDLLIGADDRAIGHG